MLRNIFASTITILFIITAVIPVNLVSFTPSIAIDNVINSHIPLSNGNTLYVGGTGEGNYTKIQDAIDNASDGDTVFVYNSTYFENLFLEKSICLVGEDRNNTIIYPRNLSENSIIYIAANNCTIDGFSIRNEDFQEDSIGIFINSSGNKINGNIITRSKHGIYLKDITNNGHTYVGNNISNNEISNCTYGIYLYANAEKNVIYNNDIIDNLEGIDLYYCVNTSVIGNYVYSNTVYGIYISINSDGNIILRNVCIENRYGIRFKGVNFNEIYLNRLERNELGLYSCCGSSNNIIYKNTCIDNEKHASDAFLNKWDNGIIGNYWDDYNGTDNDGDGIGDTPYPIPNGNNEDRYPLMEPYKNQPPEAPFIDGPKKGKVGIKYDYIFNSTDPDGDKVFYYILWNDVNNITTPFAPSGVDLIVSHTWTKEGIFSIKARASDPFGSLSDWSELEVEIPRNKAFYVSFFLKFLERLLLNNLIKIF